MQGELCASCPPLSPPTCSVKLVADLNLQGANPVLLSRGSPCRGFDTLQQIGFGSPLRPGHDARVQPQICTLTSIQVFLSSKTKATTRLATSKSGSSAMPRSRATCVVAVPLLLFCQATSAFVSPGRMMLLGERTLNGCTRSKASMASALGTRMAAVTASKLGKALKKPTGALTIGFQVCPSSPMEARSSEELSTLLRKSKASIIFTNDASTLSHVAKEQARAKGNFPGPCPVVSWAFSEEEVNAAQAAGASGVVLSVQQLGVAEAARLAAIAEAKMDVLYEVQSASEAEEAAKAGAKVVLARGSDLESIRNSLPKEVVAVASVEAMQAAGGEVGVSQSLKAAGYNSIMLANACVGDGEDQNYVKWAVDTVLSKQSKEFKITGMTGHVNGHYGTGTFEKAQSEVRLCSHPCLRASS